MDVNDSVTQISALERFVAGTLDLEQFEEMLKKFDAFAFLGVSGSEETHSKILAWLLDPRGNHSAGDFFLTTLLRETGAATDEQIHNIDWSNTTVQREWYNVVDGTTGFLDILVLNAEAHFVCAIENKVFSTEHSEQLTRYRKAVELHWGSFQRSHLFLSRHGTPPERPKERQFWTSVGYETVLQLVEKTIEHGVGAGKKEVMAFLRQYSTTLRMRIVPDTEMKRLATRIYLQHREAIELIYRHKEDYIGDLSKICSKAIDRQESWELIGSRSGNRLLAFIDPSWKEFRTFHKGTLLLPESDALLWLDFDFRVIGEVTLILTMSAGNIKDDFRKLLFDKTKGRHPYIFNHRGSPRGEYSSSTVRLYASEPILSEFDIISGDESSCSDRIMKWVSNFAKVEFRDINRIIVDSLEEIDDELECGQALVEKK